MSHRSFWPASPTRIARFLVALVVALGVLSGSMTAGVGPQAAAAVTAPLRLGVAYGDDLTWSNDRGLNSALNHASRLGIDWIRVDLSWADIQWDGPDQYLWNRFDRVVAAARSHHLQVLATIAYTPPWARQPGCSTPSCPPADPARFADFARLAAARYAPLGVHQWEVWNEPNGGGFWIPRADPAAFTKLLVTTAAAIKGVDPKATIVLGGLAALRDTAADDDPVAFLTEVARRGGTKVVDAVGFHPYTYPYRASFRAPWRTAWDLMLPPGSPPPPAGSPRDLRTVLRAYQTPDLPIWITEYGAPTGGPNAPADGSPESIGPGTTHVTQAWQATLAADAVHTAAVDPEVQALMWYSDRDRSTDAQSNENFYGLRNRDGSRKPAFYAYRQAIQEVRASRPKGLPVG
jgi:hypothetical protein